MSKICIKKSILRILLLSIFLIILISLSAVLIKNPQPFKSKAATPSRAPKKIINNYIIGGQPADPGEWPFVIAIYEKQKDKILTDLTKNFFCAGSLISPKWIITAAHCLYTLDGDDEFDNVNTIQNKKRDLSNLIIVLNLYSKKNSNTVEIRSIKKLIINENLKTVKNTKLFFNDITLINDIALIEIDPVYNASSISISDNYNLLLEKATMLGWGSSNDMGKSSDILQEVSINIVPIPQWKKPFYPNFISLSNQNKGSCKGDSGGPIVVWDKNKSKWFLIGIISQGERCGTDEYHTDVTKYTQWIYQKTKIPLNNGVFVGKQPN